MLFARLVMILFQSTPSVGRATFNFSPNHSLSSFQSTPSVGRATRGQRQTTKRHSDFNPRPPWGGRRMPTKNMDSRSIFQSTPSVGRATVGEIYGPNIPVKISIHALRGEGDQERSQCQIRDNEHFNPRPPWGGRHDIRPQALVEYNISIHALRGEGDNTTSMAELCSTRFQSTPSVGRATLGFVASIIYSIYFNPRPPWGGRREAGDAAVLSGLYFNPRPPWGGRLSGAKTAAKNYDISIHALRGEGDDNRRRQILYFAHFNPRPPWGGRL